MNLRAIVWTSDLDSAIELQSDVLRSIKNKFDEEGIEIPFPYRTIILKDKITVNNEK